MAILSPYPDQSEAEFIRVILNVVAELKEKGLGNLREELGKEGHISIGPMLPNEALGIRDRALEVGAQAVVCTL